MDDIYKFSRRGGRRGVQLLVAKHRYFSSPSNRANILSSRRRLVKEPVHHPFETLFEKSPFSLEPRFIAGRKLRALSLFRFLPSPFSLPSNGADTTKSDNNTRSNSSWRNDLLSLPFDRQLVESSERFFSRGRIRVDDGKSRVARPNST